MTTEFSPFDHAPDPVLGEALRDVLAVSDDGEFVSRVLHGVGAAETSWEVLGGWARPAVAAAFLLLAAVGLVLGRLTGPADRSLVAGDGAQIVAGLEVSALFGDSALPDLETVLGAEH